MAAADEPVDALRATIGARVLVAGKLTDVERRVTGGFVRGRAEVEGLDGHRGRQYLFAYSVRRRLPFVKRLRALPGRRQPLHLTDDRFDCSGGVGVHAGHRGVSTLPRSDGIVGMMVGRVIGVGITQ